MDIEFRFGQEADTHLIADYIIAAGDGVFESMLDGVVPGVGAREFVCMAVNAQESPLNYANAVIAEVGGAVAGMALGYPSSEYGLHPLLRTVVPNRRIEPLSALFASSVPESWYLNTLIVAEAARDRGLGKFLVQFCADLAQENGFSSISLHSWADNTKALRVYQSLGFHEIETVPVKLRTKPERDCPMALLTAQLPLGN